MTGILWAVLTEPLSIDRRFSCGEPHHVTLAYGAEKTDFQMWLGTLIPVGCTFEWWGDGSSLTAKQIQAVQVTLPPNVPFKLEVPHISVSWAEGVQAVEATAMIRSPSSHLRQFRRQLEARIEFYEWQEAS